MCLRFLAEFILSHRRARNDRGEGQTMMVRQAHHERIGNHERYFPPLILSGVEGHERSQYVILRESFRGRTTEESKRSQLQ